MDNQTIRIFVSSPSDVDAERRRISQVVERVQQDFPNVKLEAIRWEENVYSARETFQKQIVAPDKADLVVCVLWKRLGSELPDDYKREDGTIPTGTEYEFETAMDKALVEQVPDILLYRKTEKVFYDADRLEQEKAEMQALEAFWRRWVQNEQGHFTAAFKPFESTDFFEQQFEQDLRVWLSNQTQEVTWPEAKGSPYRGLQVFEPEHAPIFFGRRRAVQEVRARLLANYERDAKGFLLVVGASGSGKSSLVRAGILPKLQNTLSMADVVQWRHEVLKPSELGDNPMQTLARRISQSKVLPELLTGDYADEDEIATFWNTGTNQAQPLKAALRRASQALQEKENYQQPPKVRLLLVWDQFEEIFHLADNARDELLAWITALVESGQVWVIATIRSDFYPEILGVPALMNLKKDGRQSDLGPPRPHELKEIIQGPAKAAGLSFDVDDKGESLDEVLHDEAEKSPESLPLLEFALEQLYLHRDKENKLLSFAAYEEMGGLAGAISQKAESTYAEIDDHSEDVFNNVMGHLIAVNEEGRATRKQVSIEQFDANPAEKAFVEAFLNARLLVADTDDHGRTNVLLTHEALLHQWQRIKHFVAANQEYLRWYSRVSKETKIWHLEKENNAYLLPSGKPLEEAKIWLDKRQNQMQEQVAEFVQLSIKREVVKRRNRFMIVAASMLVLITLTFLSFLNAQKAERESLRAMEQTEIAQRESDKNALLLAEEQFVTGVDKGNEGAIKQAFTAFSEALKVNPEQKAQIAAGHLLARQLKAVEGDQIPLPRRTDDAIFFGEDDNILHLYSLYYPRIYSSDDDYADYKPIITFHYYDWHIKYAFSAPDSSWLALLNKNSLNIWNPTDGSLIRELEIFADDIADFHMDPDSGIVTMVSEAGSMSVYDTSDWRLLHEAKLEPLDDAYFTAVLKVGEHIFSGDNKGQIYRGTMTQTPMPWNKLDGYVWQLVTDPQKRFVAVSNKGSTLPIYGVAEGTEDIEVAFGSAVASVDFSDDGLLLAGASWDNTVQIINLTNGNTEVVSGIHTSSAYEVRFLDGRRIATVSADDTFVVYNLETEEIELRLEHDSDVVDLSVSSDGNKAITTTRNGVTRIVDIPAQSNRILGNSQAKSFVYSPDGKKVTVLTGDQLLEWDIASGKLLTQIKEEFDQLVYLPHSESMMAVNEEGTVSYINSGTDETDPGFTDASVNLLGSSENYYWNYVTTDEAAIVWKYIDGQVQVVYGVETNSPAIATATDNQDRYLAILEESGRFSVIDVDQKTVLTNIQWERPVEQIAFAKNGGYFVLRDDDDKVVAWDLATSNITFDMSNTPWHEARTFIAHPESSLVAFIDSSTEHVLLFDVASSVRLPGRILSSGNMDLLFDPTGERILIYGYRADGYAIQLVDIERMRTLFTLDGLNRDEGFEHVAAFTPDGSAIGILSEHQLYHLRLKPSLEQSMLQLRGEDLVTNQQIFSRSSKNYVALEYQDGFALFDLTQGAPLSHSIDELSSATAVYQIVDDEQLVGYSTESTYKLASFKGQIKSQIAIAQLPAHVTYHAESNSLTFVYEESIEFRDLDGAVQWQYDLGASATAWHAYVTPNSVLLVDESNYVMLNGTNGELLCHREISFFDQGALPLTLTTDGSQAFVIDNSYDIELLDTSNCEHIRTITTSAAALRMQLNDDGTQLVASIYNQPTFIYNIEAQDNQSANTQVGVDESEQSENQQGNATQIPITDNFSPFADALGPEGTMMIYGRLNNEVLMYRLIELESGKTILEEPITSHNFQSMNGLGVFDNPDGLVVNKESYWLHQGGLLFMTAPPKGKAEDLQPLLQRASEIDSIEGWMSLHQDIMNEPSNEDLNWSQWLKLQLTDNTTDELAWRITPTKQQTSDYQWFVDKQLERASEGYSEQMYREEITIDMHTRLGALYGERIWLSDFPTDRECSVIFETADEEEVQLRLSKTEYEDYGWIEDSSGRFVAFTATSEGLPIEFAVEDLQRFEEDPFHTHVRSTSIKILVGVYCIGWGQSKSSIYSDPNPSTPTPLKKRLQPGLGST